MSQPNAQRKRRILLISEPAGGGVRHHVVDLLSELSSDRFDVTVLYGTSRMDGAFLEALPELSKKWSVRGVPSLRREISPWDLAAFFVIVREILRVRPDVVHCHSSKAGILGRFAAWLLRVPTILYTPHCYSFQLPRLSRRKKSLYCGLERFFTRHCTTYTLNVSQGERRQALEASLGEAGAFVVIPNGLPPLAGSNREAARAVLGVSADTPVVGVAARLDEQKNPHMFFEIAVSVCKANEKAVFVALGDGPLLEELRTRAIGAGLADRIVFLGYREDSAILTEGFDVYLLTSHCEGLPYSLLEAARAGIPMVATQVTGNDELVSQGTNGFLFPEDQPEEGAALVQRLLCETSLSAEAIRADFTARFSLAQMVEAIEGMYGKL